tara:strand:- start:70 stop:492 length:423 start_codon:yes stop_codon:yes gene_type:complete
MKSFEIAWISIFFSALFIIHFSYSEFYYTNFIILQLLLILFVYKLNNRQRDNNTFSITPVLGLIILHILIIVESIQFYKTSTVYALLKTILVVLTIFSATTELKLDIDPNLFKNLSMISMISLFIWYLFEKNALSFNIQK